MPKKMPTNIEVVLSTHGVDEKVNMVYFVKPSAQLNVGDNHGKAFIIEIGY